MKTTITTSKAKKIAQKLFNMDAYKSNQSTKVELTYYSNRAERIITLSTCRTSANGLASAVEWLYNNKDIPSILITGYKVIKNISGKTKHFDFVEEITRLDLDNNL